MLVSLAAAGIGAGVFASSGGASPTGGDAADATTRVRVIATDFKFTLSRRSVPATGTVIFTVVNRGKIAHDFRIAGKKTRILAPGKSQVLRVVIRRKGRYAYVCTLTGHAAAGMKGTFSVGRPAAPTTTTTPTTTTPTTVTGPATTITVDMFEYRFALSQNTVPSGTVTFVITNRGQEPHNFSITSVKVGTILSAGQTETYTVAMPPRSYEYVCDVPFHIGFGMVGQLNVT
jgi:uncharacterized cupredoxin-like copper-binding protein